MKAIFFDLDGTLLPLDEKLFVDIYFAELSKVFSVYNIDSKKLVETIWTATHEIIKNDGKRTNEEAFWDKFKSIVNIDLSDVKEVLKKFYANEFFTKLKKCSTENSLAKVAVELAKKNGRKVVLATNPVFPIDALVRLKWIGLDIDDFDYVTHYSNSSFSKPNPKYYLDLCEKLDVEPKDCLMIGNDERQDIFAASSAGMNCYLVTDYLYTYPECKVNCEKGSFEDLIEKLKVL
ncbi:HAD family hydrolase [Parvimonas micra]|uniref:HAD-IA family hydrolase n=1 Tax=Parvimonas micra TaxID=33033 RepID=A0AAX3K8E3_9FIRM|nr:HAD-IA family hydrolase [Parvimonas micra]MBF1276747.1 HAD family hydrolase [Parvimonas micra]MCK6130085.1 HAD-IA family hydrolase [Parvimonas micra]MCK6135731.1 HAD-IA family hydrolase [Parvimonas micra]MCK6137203.1 HAD-IA family hydrolase [Parvimonas micra]MCK6153730.1 HAD-IA family hydrolase [Parvimonas micra]